MTVRRKRRIPCKVGGFLLSGPLALALGTQAFAQVNILENRFDQSRTAANLSETVLTPANVNAASFGKSWTSQVDGAIFAQPLYVSNVSINGATHNVLYVATMNDVVYAFDADKPQAPLWIRDYRAPGVTPGTPFDATTASAGMGIVGTPAIDLPGSRMFFVAETMESGAYVQRLHCIDIRTGAEIRNAVIAGNANGQAFDPKLHSQRPGLAIVSGQVWIAFGSTIPGDFTPWHGWVMTYDINTLTQTGAFVTTAPQSGGGIWQSGAAPTADAAGNVYYLTGNGTGQAYDGARNFQESLLKFSYTGGLKLVDWYTAADWSTLDAYDLDLTVGGTTLIPGTNLIAFGGKVGLERVLNTGALGKFTTNDSQVVQKLQIGPVPNYVGNDGDRILGVAYWNRGANSRMYAWPGLAALTSFSFNGATFAQLQQNGLNLFGEPSAALSLSAKGATAGSGVLWVARNQGAGRTIGQPGVVEAYNADNISQLLWSSTQNATRDDVISVGRFVVPVVANGRVYMATASGSVQVYGQLSQSPPPPPPAWTKIGISATRVARGADGTAVLVNTPNGTVWRYQGAPNNWSQIPAPIAMTDVAVVNGGSLYALGTDQNVYRFDGNSWHKVGVRALTIGAASDGTVIVVSTNNTIWKKAADDNVEAWSQIPGAALRVAPRNANSYWAIGTDHNVYRGGPAGGWTQAGVSVADIATSPDGRILVTNAQTKSLWLKVTDDTTPSWSNLPQTANSVSITNGGSMMVVGVDANVYVK